MAKKSNEAVIEAADAPTDDKALSNAAVTEPTGDTDVIADNKPAEGSDPVSADDAQLVAETHVLSTGGATGSDFPVVGGTGGTGYLHSDGVYRSTPPSIADVAADIAFLRKQFGWPTKDA